MAGAARTVVLVAKVQLRGRDDKLGIKDGNPAGSSTTACPGREPRPCPVLPSPAHPPILPAEEKVTSAQQPSASCQGSLVARVELCHKEGELLHYHAEPVSFLIAYSRTEAWPHLCISKRCFTMYFPKQESPWPLSARRRAVALNIFPQGLKIPGSISQDRAQGHCPGFPSPCGLGRGEQLLPSTQVSGGGGVGMGNILGHLARVSVITGHCGPCPCHTVCPFPFVPHSPK